MYIVNLHVFDRKFDRFYTWCYLSEDLCFECWAQWGRNFFEVFSLHSSANTILKYRIVPSRNTCYYSENQKIRKSENQIFCFLKSRILTCRIFFLGTKLFCLLSEWAEKNDTWQTHDVFSKHLFSAHLDNFYFLTPHVTNWIEFN